MTQLLFSGFALRELSLSQPYWAIFGSASYLKISYNMFFVNINMTILEIELTPPKNYTQNLYDSNIFMFRL